MLKRLVLFFSLLIFWFILYGKWSFQVIVFGVCISFFILWMTEKVVFNDTYLFSDKGILFRYAWFFMIVIISIIKASFSHIAKIYRNRASSDVVIYDLSHSDDLINTMIANAITLTPGTVTISLNDQQLVVACLIESEQDKAHIVKEIQSYEKPFLRSPHA